MINMMLDDLAPGHGPNTRFMTRIGIVIGNMSTVFYTARHHDDYLAQLNKQLAMVGAKATYGSDDGYTYQTVLDLCAGQRVTISQMHTTPSTVVATHLDSALNYLDIELDISGCHDEFDGILGQLYQCK